MSFLEFFIWFVFLENWSQNRIKFLFSTVLYKLAFFKIKYSISFCILKTIIYLKFFLPQLFFS